jgi:hypothetical protein
MLPYTPHPDAPIEAVCAATYYADLVLAFAFVFRVEATKTRFTVYASAPDAYTINSTYQLTICDPGQLPLFLAADEAEFLQQCLRLVEDRWHEAIGQADAGTARPEADRTAEPGHINVEPSPAGYRTIADRLRHEQDRVRRLRQRVHHLLTRLPSMDGDPS